MKSSFLLTSVLLPAFGFLSSSIRAAPLSVTETVQGDVEQEAGTQTNFPSEAYFEHEDVTPIERHSPAKESAGEQVAHELQQKPSPPPQLKSEGASIALLKSVIYFAVVFIVTYAFHVTMVEPKLMKMDIEEFSKGKRFAASEEDVDELFRRKHPIITGISWITLALTLAMFVNMYFRMFKAVIQMLIDSFNAPMRRSLAD
ncbi:hypothetical protein Emag_002743 [Eimeria magna]